MTFTDRFLSCRDCSASFLFSAGEQEFFSTKGLTNEPKRCHNCRVLMKVRRSGKDEEATSEVTCAECNTPTRVPFKPSGYKPVYCSACFNAKKCAADTAQAAAAPLLAV